MSRRAAIIEEFDDDTDLPLPNQPLPNRGEHGPILEEITEPNSDDSDDDDDDADPGEFNFPHGLGHAGPASPASQSQNFRANTVTDITPYKTWTCIYPLYIDAKRPFSPGLRRIARPDSVWWPLSKDIADASNRLGLGTLHEVQKTHPRDWENPGRVRVQWRRDGRFVNPEIRTKKQLLQKIALQIQHLKPENVPKPPYHTSQTQPTPQNTTPTPTTKPTSNKGKSPAKKPTTTPTSHNHNHPQPKKGKRSCPAPPHQSLTTPLTTRLSPYSPAIETGVLIETIKAGMNAQNQEGAGGGGGGAGGFGMPGMGGGGGQGGVPGGQKGKRKVVRVRG